MSTHWGQVFCKFSADILFDHGLNSVFWAESQKIWHSHDRTPTRPALRPSAPHVYQCLISHFQASLGACNLVLLVLNIHVLINWQLSKQCICWPVSPDRIEGSAIYPLSSSVFWSYPLTKCYFSNDRRLKFIFFKMRMKYVVFMSRTFKSLISNWPRTQKFNQLLQAGKAITIVMRWSLSTSNFYALIGQNLKGEFMREKFMEHLETFSDCWNWQSLCNLDMYSFSIGCTKWNTLFFINKNVVFPAQAEYSYSSGDFRLKIFLYYS